jgi:tRNA 2-thiouridine synthesizing protein A
MSDSHAQANERLDVRGLICPLTVIRTQDRIKHLAAGTLLEIVATDPGAMHDIPAWCRVHGHEVLAMQQHDREISIRVRIARDR